MKKLLTIICLLSLFSCSEFEVKDIKNGVIIKNNDNQCLKVQFYSPKTIRVTQTIDGNLNNNSLVVLDSLAIDVDFSKEDNGSTILLTSQASKVEISKDFSIRFFDENNQEILKHNANANFSPKEYFGDKAYTVNQTFSISPEEAIYGFGQNQDGVMNYHGKQVDIIQSNINAVSPVFVSTNGYGMFWDNYSKTTFKEENNQFSLESEMADNIDYYLFVDKNIDNIIKEYRNLTGKAPMLARWAFGYWQSKERYKTQEELLEVARKYRKMNIPIDVMVQDWNWWEENKWSCMEFDQSRYPNPKAMVDELHQNNYHCMISVWPCVGRQSNMFRDMESQGLLYYPVGWANFKYIDAYNPKAMEVYLDYLNKGVTPQGFDCWWIDSTEPDVTNALTKESHLYEMRRMGNNHLGSFARYLNPYVLCFLDKVYDNWYNIGKKDRLCILTRSSWAGIQRNGAITWSGDIGASWEVFADQITAGLNYNLSGTPYWTFDIGAYLIGSYEGVFTYGAKDPAYIELYTRMFQFASMCPIFRSHGSDEPREMWHMGENLPILVKYDNLRYRLMPYIYSNAGRVANFDYTMMRALCMDFADDKNVLNIKDQYMFGDNLMVCPVTNYMYHVPPQISNLVPTECFKTLDGQQGIKAEYFNDPEFKNLTHTAIEPRVDAYWYSGRPEYVTDSTYSIRYTGKIIPKETGKHQFQIKSFDSRLIVINGDTLDVIYGGNEPYYQFIDLEAGKEYDIVCETVNQQTGAARFRLFWKTPSDFAKENSKADAPKTREVYLPKGYEWYNFWTGEKYPGGQTITVDAPIDIMPIFVKAGSIIPMGEIGQYADQKANSEELEIRLYTGADGKFTLYEDDGNSLDYKEGKYSTIDFLYNHQNRVLLICERKGEFNNMPKKRKFKIIINGKGIDSPNTDFTVEYLGQEISLGI